MAFNSVKGYPPIKRFVRGHLYYIESSNKNKYMVGEFRGKKYFDYVFTTIATSNHDLSSYVFEITQSSMAYASVREVFYEDMPLFINASHITVFYKRLVAGQPMRLRKARLIKHRSRL